MKFKFVNSSSMTNIMLKKQKIQDKRAENYLEIAKVLSQYTND